MGNPTTGSWGMDLHFILSFLFSLRQRVSSVSLCLSFAFFRPGLELMWPSSGGPSNREEYDVEAGSWHFLVEDLTWIVSLSILSCMPLGTGDFDRGTSVSVSIPNVDFPMDISFTVLDVDPPIRAEVGSCPVFSVPLLHFFSRAWAIDGVMRFVSMFWWCTC